MAVSSRRWPFDTSSVAYVAVPTLVVENGPRTISAYTSSARNKNAAIRTSLITTCDEIRVALRYCDGNARDVFNVRWKRYGRRMSHVSPVSTSNIKDADGGVHLWPYAVGIASQHHHLRR